MAAKYSQAPISEVVCGIIFNTNLLLNNGAIFKLLISISEAYPIRQTIPTISNEEIINGSISVSTDYANAGFTTYRQTTEDTKWQILIQQNMVTLHWVRQDEQTVGNYPGYNEIVAKFKEVYNITKAAVGDDLKFNASIKSYYLSYTDRVNMAHFKEQGLSVHDLINLAPLSFTAFNKAHVADNYFVRFSGPCDEIKGYFIASINSPTLPGLGQILIIENKLKGTPHQFNSIDEWFDNAHEIQFSFFESIFKSSILEKWK